MLKTNERERRKRINEGKVNALSAVWQEQDVFRSYEAEGRIRRRAVASKHHYSDLCFGNHRDEEGRDAERLVVVPTHNDFATTTAKPWFFFFFMNDFN